MKDVLIVEDTAAMLMLFEAILQRNGYETCTAETAKEAVKVFARNDPSVILLDLMLPDRDGLELMQDFLSQKPELNIVVITANGSMNKAVEAMRLGAFDFLVKPVSDQRLADTIRLACESSVAVSVPAPSYAIQETEADLKADLAIQRLVGLPFEEIERAVIEATIDRCAGSLPKAAELLHLAPSTLYRKREAWINKETTPKSVSPDPKADP